MNLTDLKYTPLLYTKRAARRTYFSLLALALVFFYGCSGDDSSVNPGPEINSDLVESLEVQLNPSGYSPLTALVTLETSEAVSVEYPCGAVGEMPLP